MRSYSTLRDLIDGNFTITAYHDQTNPPCAHGSDLDLNALAQKLGPDFDIVQNHDAFVKSLRCSKCGAVGTGMSITLSPPAWGR